MEKLSKELREKKKREENDPVIQEHVRRSKREAGHSASVEPVVSKENEVEDESDEHEDESSDFEPKSSLDEFPKFDEKPKKRGRKVDDHFEESEE